MIKLSYLLLSSIFLVSASNAMNNDSIHDFHKDIIAVQHTITNLIDMQECNNDPTLNKDKTGGFNISFVVPLLKLDDFKKSPQGNARKHLNDIIDCMINCNYIQTNEVNNNEIYKQLKNNFNQLLKINTDNLSNAHGQTLTILNNTREIFLKMCQVVKNENTNKYHFITDDINNEDVYRKLQFNLGKSLFQKSQNSTKPELEHLANWSMNEILLHKSFLLVLYCEKLAMDFERFPKDFAKYISDGTTSYWNNIFRFFKIDVAPYFK